MGTSVIVDFKAIICHQYVAGAIPGKSLKKKTTKSDDKREKTKKYEEYRKARKFNDNCLKTCQK
jgi:hypothetical protein